MGLLTVEQLREAVSSSLTDDRLQELLDATEQDILAAAGGENDQTEYATGGYRNLVLARPIGTPVSVTEYAETANELELEGDDYRVDGYMLHRLDTGTNPSRYWRGQVEVVHTAPDRTAERIRAQVALVRLDLAIASGVTTERIGDYAVGYGNTAGGTDYQKARQLILDSLKPLMVA